MQPTRCHYLIALPLLLAPLFLASCGKATEAAPAPQAGSNPVPVTLSATKVVELQRSVRIVGSLAGLETATLSNRITGRISQVYVDRGDRVKPSQKLLEIEPERFNLAVTEAESSLAQTLARLGLKEVPPPDFDVNQTAPVKKARSDYENAKSKMDRATPVHNSKTMNDFEYFDIVSAFNSAESALENSRDEARALVAQARQNRTWIDMKTQDSKDSIINAPDGRTPDGLTIDSYVVSDRKVSTGEYLREGTALFTLVADSTLKLQARVPERYLGDIKKGAQVSFHVEAYPDETFLGTVRIIDPTVDPANRTFQVEAIVDNAKYGGRLRPGSFVPGEVLTKKEPNRVMVPVDAVTSFVGVTKVYKLDPSGQKVQAVDVTTGQQIADGANRQWIEIIKGGIKPDDRVAVTGLSKLVDGSTVRIVDAPAAPTVTN